jgi:protein-S-isoprenylcysteine O-methyltransferase Ste14
VFILARAVVYASLFIGVLLVFLPARVVARSGIPAPAGWGAEQVLGLLFVIAGAVLAVSCILAFAFIGRGTPAPFDPPRRLVVRGPYRWVRNPMYVGAGTALLGAALYYDSLPLLAYGVGFLLAMHLFVVLYEEPVLRRAFGPEYEEYRRRVGRWWPRLGSRNPTGPRM